MCNTDLVNILTPSMKSPCICIFQTSGILCYVCILHDSKRHLLQTECNYFEVSCKILVNFQQIYGISRMGSSYNNPMAHTFSDHALAHTHAHAHARVHTRAHTHTHTHTYTDIGRPCILKY